ncbi:MBL fold metallo-hydrolase [Candidatus Bipolaricaulota bacterium]|nr:MBL fold metallo-hydrolase [Candidatus Bipolaricaulota bacterium]
MEPIELIAGVWVFPGAVNLGVIAAEGRAVFIDAGLDDSAARKLWRWAEEAGLKPHAAILTHAHADHFGGAYLWEKRGLPLYASEPEGAMMENPEFEPIFLFSGASPHPELLSKFTLAKPCRISQTLAQGPLELGSISLEIVALPGHAPAQIGVRVGPVLFCADALFPPEILSKHPIPFCHDFSGALSSLRNVEEAEVVVPGHGPILRNAEVRGACGEFRDRLEQIKDLVFQETTNPKSAEEILAKVAAELGAKLQTITEFLLARTTILAALTALVREGLVEAVLEGNLLWRRR